MGGVVAISIQELMILW